MSTAIFTLVGTLGGILLTGLISWLRTKADHEQEREMEKLRFQSATQESRRSEHRESYRDFLVATNDAYQLASDLFRRAREGDSLDFRSETRDIIAELMKQELSLDLVASAKVRRAARKYVESLRSLLIDATKGKWADTSQESRSELFKSMIADINPGEEPVRAAEVTPVQ